MIIDNHVTVIEIVIINGGHKLAVMAPTIMTVAATRYVTVQLFSHLEYGTIILNLSTVFKSMKYIEIKLQFIFHQNA